MNIDHRLWMALVSDAAPQDASKSDMVNYLADAADASWAYALAWYNDWLAKQEAPAEGYISEDPLIDAEIKNAADAQDEAYGCMADWGAPEAWWDACVRFQESFGQKCDAINPSHYQQGSVQCIDAICDALGDGQFKGYLRGNVMKYLWRLEHKGCPLENAKKAQWYLDRFISELELEKECE